jgi:Holliday junction resolvase RusA-like endonuclease
LTSVTLTILGQPCSKSNRSQIVNLGGRVSIGKSADAKAYIRSTLPQIPPKARLRLQGPVRFTARVFYENERSDLDESQLLDCLQDQWKRDKTTGERVLIQAGVYRNDNQVREKHIYHSVDKRNPRAEVVIEPLQMQAQDLFAPLPFEAQLDPAGAAF